MPTLSDLWTTPIWLAQTNLPLDHAAIHSALSTADGEDCVAIPADTILTDLDAAQTQFRAAIALATGDPDCAPTTTVFHVHLLREGHSVGLAYGAGDWAGWCVLAATGARSGSPSGMLSLHDPRAGSSGADAPGSPWGRPLTIKPEPGLAVVFPGWVGHSISPVDPGHRILLLTATTTIPGTEVSQP